MNLPKSKLDSKAALDLWKGEHSDYAKEQAVLSNLGIIGIVLRRMGLNPFDEDLFATGIVGLVKAINGFDVEKGYQFSTYATRCVSNEILMTFRKKRIETAFSLDDTFKIGNGEEVSYKEIIPDNKNIEESVIAKESVENYMSNLSDREKQIICLQMNGKTQQQIADDMGLTQSYVSRILKSAYKKYEKCCFGKRWFE